MADQAEQKDFLDPAAFGAAVSSLWAGENTVALGLSGGPDSMALCWLLSQWAVHNNGPAIHALTVDHGLRAEAADEARQVSEWVKDWPHVTHNILSLKNLSSDSAVMEKARQARYDILADYCRTHAIARLFLAHHQDDQAETFLFRLAKGSGLDGLAAMRRKQSYNDDLLLCRPLLAVSKVQLIATCKNNDIPFVEDPTNDDDHFARSRLRQSRDILAQEGLSAKRLAVTARRMARARDALEFFTDRVLTNVMQAHDDGSLSLDYAGLKSQPEDIRLRVIVKAMGMVAPDDGGYGPRREKAEDLVAALFSESPFPRRTLGGVIWARDDKNGLILLEKE